MLLTPQTNKDSIHVLAVRIVAAGIQQCLPIKLVTCKSQSVYLTYLTDMHTAHTKESVVVQRMS